MLAGYRIVSPDELGVWSGDFVQISVYKWLDNRMSLMTECIKRCRDSNTNYVVHPVGYELLNEGYEGLAEIDQMAMNSDWALIIHDERNSNGERLGNAEQKKFRQILDRFNEHSPITIENAASTADAPWFWNTFAKSITLDIGHIEASGLNSVDYINSLDEKTINKIDYVHLHRKGEWRSGLIDHWPITPECRELRALGVLLVKRPDVRVILELNETQGTGENLELVRQLWDELKPQGKT